LRDLVNDLDTARFQTWVEAFSRLIDHCESDEVMRVITGPLKTNPAVDADRWWTDALDSVRGMAGSGHYELPTDDDNRTALLYQVFLKVEHEDLDITKFCSRVYGLSSYQLPRNRRYFQRRTGLEVHSGADLSLG